MSEPYQIVYADPAWEFKNFNHKNSDHDPSLTRGAAKHYRTMPTDMICNLNFPIADNAALFLWISNPLLPDAMTVIEAWGFTFKTFAFTWAKQNPTSFGWHMGMGYTTRGNCEHVLLATRGKGLGRPADMGVRSLVIHPVMQHSRKPNIVIDLIDRLYPPELFPHRLELFRRGKPEAGWHSWGDQAEGSIELDFDRPADK